MLNKVQWEARAEELVNLEKQLAKLDEQRKKTAKKIYYLRYSLNQHNKHQNRQINTSTEVYKMFGKPLKELTKEEYNMYYNERQKIRRQKLKEKKV